MTRMGPIILLLILLVGCASPTPAPPPSPAEVTLAAGQEWKYHNRPGEDDSRVIILKLEPGKDGTPLAHIAVTNLSEEGTVHHLPFTEKAVRASLTELVGTIDYESEPEGYKLWKTDYDHGKAGVFDQPVAEAVGLVLKRAREQRPKAEESGTPAGDESAP